MPSEHLGPSTKRISRRVDLSGGSWTGLSSSDAGNAGSVLCWASLAWHSPGRAFPGWKGRRTGEPVLRTHSPWRPQRLARVFIPRPTLLPPSVRISSSTSSFMPSRPNIEDQESELTLPQHNLSFPFPRPYARQHQKYLPDFASHVWKERPGWPRPSRPTPTARLVSSLELQHQVFFVVHVYLEHAISPKNSLIYLFSGAVSPNRLVNMMVESARTSG